MNLLTDQILRVESPEGIAAMSLPELLTALGEDRVLSLPGMQRHQEDAFHIFLCYLAGAVLAREDQGEPLQAEDFWREGIRRLTGRDDDCAWTLIVEDVAKPAFMQPALTSNAASNLRLKEPKALTPDQLDVLQTATNHDVKTRRALRPPVEAWIFALVSLQTMTGQMGRDNYGIARMNSGTGSRVCVGIVYEPGFGGCWYRDTRKLLALRQELLRPPWPYQSKGLALTWCEKWDLKTSFPLSALDPFFIECARAVRLIEIEGGIAALGAGSSGTHIEGKASKGVLGDPWTPIVVDGPKAWTVTDPFFTPEKLRNLIFEDGFQAPAMQKPDLDREGQGCRIRAAVLSPGGMGKSDGFHEAEIPIPSAAARRLFRRGPDHDRLAELSREAVNDAGQMQKKVLKPAVFSLLEAGPEQINFDRREASGWWEQAAQKFSAAWHTDFFSWLWRSVEHPDPETARFQWLDALRVNANTVLKDAIDRYPGRAGRRYRARVRAEGVFNGSLYKNCPIIKEEKS